MLSATGNGGNGKRAPSMPHAVTDPSSLCVTRIPLLLSQAGSVKGQRGGGAQSSLCGQPADLRLDGPLESVPSMTQISIPQFSLLVILLSLTSALQLHCKSTLLLTPNCFEAPIH